MKTRARVERQSSEVLAPSKASAPMSRTTSSPSGAPLDAAVRTAIEPSFDFDFSRVRVHADPAASRVADAASARALSVGEDLFFAEGEYNAATPQGLQLIAHELAHVVQRATATRPSAWMSRRGDAAEQEASQAATTAMAGGTVSLGASAPAVVAREGKGEDDSIFGMFSELAKAPEETGLSEVMKHAGAPKGPLDALGPIGNLFGVAGGLDKAAHSDDLLGMFSGATGAVGSGMGAAGWAAEHLGGSSMWGGALGGMGGLFSAGGSALDAVSDFQKGEYGKGALDVTKTAAGTLSGLGTLGGFSVAASGEMAAGAALAGEGLTGLASFGPAGAVLGSGLAGAAVGTAGLGAANKYAKKHDIFGGERDSTEAAADTGIAVSDYLHSTWVPDAIGTGVGAATSMVSSIGTAGYSGLHAAGSAIADVFSGPSIFDIAKQQMALQESTNKTSAQMGDFMSQRDNEQSRRELYGY